jgi:ABC-type transporter MlaC component
MSKRSYKVILLAFLCSISLQMFLPIFTANGQTGKETIEALVRIFSGRKENNSSTDKARFKEAANYIDYENMAQQAIGTNYWNKLSNAQKKSYVQSFRVLVEQRYYKRWHRIFSKSKIIYTGEEKLPSDNTLVKTKIITGSNNKMAIWTLSGTEPKVVNLTIDDRDLVKRAYARFQRKIKGVGVTSFVGWIQHRAKHPEKEEP